MTACASCGRANDPGAQFCIDCGKPLGESTGQPAATAAPVDGGAAAAPSTRVAIPSAAAARGETLPCPFCGAPISGRLPFCAHCGRRLTAPGSGPTCARCGSSVPAGTRFCAACGAPVVTAVALRRSPGPAAQRAAGPIVLVLVDEAGHPERRFERGVPATTIGRYDGDLRFPDDVFLSPVHAKISWEQDALVVRDLGSRNGTWVFLEAPYRLIDDDLLLIGSQVIRFRRLGYPGPHAPDADATKRMGSLVPSADIASLIQLRADGSGRDIVHLSPGRDITIGREEGDWRFPYDQSMSAHHARIRSEDADFVVVDESSRNGIALAARGGVPLQHNSRILVGDKLFRVELAT